MNDVGVAHTEYREWRESSFNQRKECLQKFADLLQANADDYAGPITLDMGKRMCLRDCEPHHPVKY